MTTELARLNAQALELCAELSGLRRENERLRGLLREARHVLLNWKAGNIEGMETNRVLARINAALAEAVVQPTVCDWPACGCKRGSDYECAQGYSRATSPTGDATKC